jgi:hypothetical protein|tara:strand:- start:1602 stop:1925 length:324 start_codon:yes stop_codon:yes gene_type:complete
MKLTEYDGVRKLEDSRNYALGMMMVHFIIGRYLTNQSPESVTTEQVRELIGEREKYVQYRDVAIALGADTSRLPKTIRVTKPLSTKINELEKRDRRINQLKIKFGRT